MWENCFGYDEEGNPGNLSFNHCAFEIEVVVPCNARATVAMPDGTVHEIGSGTYRYTCAP